MPYVRKQLLARHNFGINCFDSDGDRFIATFREVWKKLPRGVRRNILQYWNETRSYYTPLFELSNMWSPANAYGQVRRVGLELRFRANAFDHFPPCAARWVIAHELAHVYQKTIGRLPGGENEDENEKHANELTVAWGFKRTCLDVVHMREDNLKVSFSEACAGAAAFPFCE